MKRGYRPLLQREGCYLHTTIAAAVLVALSVRVPDASAQSAPNLLGYRLGTRAADATRSLPCTVVRTSLLMCEANDSASLTFLGDTLVMIMYYQRSPAPGSASDVWRQRWASWSERLFGPVDSVRVTDPTSSVKEGKDIATRLLTAWWTSTWRRGWTAAVMVSQTTVGRFDFAQTTVFLKCNWAVGLSVALCPPQP